MRQALHPDCPECQRLWHHGHAVNCSRRFADRYLTPVSMDGGETAAGEAVAVRFDGVPAQPRKRTSKAIWCVREVHERCRSDWGDKPCRCTCHVENPRVREVDLIADRIIRDWNTRAYFDAGVQGLPKDEREAIQGAVMTLLGEPADVETIAAETRRAFAEYIFSAYPDQPRAVRVRYEDRDGTKRGDWREFIAFDAQEAAAIAEEHNKKADVYIIGNPLARRPAYQTENDDVSHICFLPLDLDAKHLDHSRAATAEQLEAMLAALSGFKERVLAFTGNGYLAIGEVDQENTESNAESRKRFMHRLKETFSSLDVSTHNAGRLIRFIGTVNRSPLSVGKDGVPKQTYLIRPLD